MSRGRIEYCYNGTRYSLCADGWDTTGNEAHVVCNTMGYDCKYWLCYEKVHQYSPIIIASVVIDIGRGTTPFNVTCATGLETAITEDLDNGQCTHVAGVDCRGRFSNDSNTFLMVTLVAAPCVTNSRTDCDDCYAYTGYGFCNCDTDCYEIGDCCSDMSVAKKRCYGKQTQYIVIIITLSLELDNVCTHGAVRLVDGLFNYTGKLEFCAHGRWGEVCNKPEFWGPDNTKVVCHQLGFPEEGKEITL